MFSTSKALTVKVKKFLAVVTSGTVKRHRRGERRSSTPGSSRCSPCHVWDLQNSIDIYASVGDLCAHLGHRLPIHIVKLIARDILHGLQRFHETEGKAHGDINQDFMLISPQDMKDLIKKYGTPFPYDKQDSSLLETRVLEISWLVAPQLQSAVFKLCRPGIGVPRHDTLCDSVGVRAPEVILDAPRGMGMDVWTLGCVLYELLTGDSLFDPFFQTVELGLSPDESHLIQIIETLGEFPSDLLQSGKNSPRWFRENGSLHIDTTYYPVMLKEILSLRIEESEVIDTADFLGSMLRLSPRDRAQASDLVNHPWLST